jgi:hypothetical protein
MGKPEDQQKEYDNVVVGTRVTKPMFNAVLRCLQLDSHITIADYLRDVLRRDLEAKGFLKTEVRAILKNRGT